VLTSFSVVLGTLAIQGLTLKPLLRTLDLHDEDLVGRELTAARERALRGALASFAGERSPIAERFRQEFTARLADERANADLDSASRSSEGSPAIGPRHAYQRRDRGRCLSSNRRGIGLDLDGKRSKGAIGSLVVGLEDFTRQQGRGNRSSA
jgi:NhaP-type Na+/H+ or K+/H+ antiporter